MVQQTHGGWFFYLYIVQKGAHFSLYTTTSWTNLIEYFSKMQQPPPIKVASLALFFPFF